MITNIRLRHFKCFDKLDLSVGKLTLLTGRNATGKSSIIQSLLLLHQSIVSMNQGKKIPLNGEVITLGTFGDVIDGRSGRKNFSVGISSNDCCIDWTFESEDKTALVAPLVKVNGPSGWSQSDPAGVDFFAIKHSDAPSKKYALQLIKELQTILYVSTERIGPRETYSADPSVDSRLGVRGEFTAWFLHRNSEKKVPELLRRSESPPLLLRQTEAWLAHFFPGAAFEVERIKDTNLLTLRFRTSTADNFHRPSNVGYGLSHLLPVLVGGLGVEPEAMLIVENPEAHLHPAAQTEIGTFLATVAAAGAQVLVETHSDHVLSGIRLAVKKGLFKSEETQIHFFNSRDAEPQVVSPIIQPDGSLDQWPSGFFDQIEKDLDQLTSW